jgi:hypothetical protein
MSILALGLSCGQPGEAKARSITVAVKLSVFFTKSIFILLLLRISFLVKSRLLKTISEARRARRASGGVLIQYVDVKRAEHNAAYESFGTVC